MLHARQFSLSAAFLMRRAQEQRGRMGEYMIPFRSWGLMPLAFGIVYLTLSVAYLPAISGPWLLDDVPNLLESRPIQEFQITSFDALRDSAVSGRSGPLGRPLSVLSFALGKGVHGELDISRIKSVNLFLHFVVVGALAYLATIFFGAWGVNKKFATFAAICSALLWGALPLHMSTVMYAIQRMAQLGTLSVLSGLAIYCHYRKDWIQRTPEVGELVALSLWMTLLIYIGVHCKENAILLLPLLPLLEIYVFGCVVDGRQSKPLKWLAYASLIAYISLPFVLYYLRPDWLIASYQERDFSLEQRVYTQLPLLWKYAYWGLIPDISSLVFLQDGQFLKETFKPPTIAGLSLMAWVALIAASFYWQLKPMLFGVLFFLVGHSMESSVFPLEISYEHRNYLPSAGLFLGFSATAVKVAAQVRRERFLAVLIACYFCFEISMLYLRANIWSSAAGIYRYATTHNPMSSRAQFLYAANLLTYDESSGETDENKALIYRAQLVESRNRLADLAINGNPDIAAIALLIRIDSKFFPALLSRDNWGPRFLTAVSSQALQAEDYAAINLVVECLVANECALSADVKNGLVTELSRFEFQPLYRAELLAKLASSGYQHSIDPLIIYTRLAAMLPNEPSIHARLVEIYSSRADLGRTIVAISQLMSVDHKRRFLRSLAESLN